MKLATTTGDYSAYTDSQTVALTHIRSAGFKYADYNFGPDYRLKNGVYSKDYKGYFTFEVGKFFAFSDKRRECSRSTLLANPPIELRDAFEKYLYELGKCILQKYDCFE